MQAPWGLGAWHPFSFLSAKLSQGRPARYFTRRRKRHSEAGGSCRVPPHGERTLGRWCASNFLLWVFAIVLFSFGASAQWGPVDGVAVGREAMASWCLTASYPPGRAELSSQDPGVGHPCAVGLATRKWIPTVGWGGAGQSRAGASVCLSRRSCRARMLSAR